MTTTLSTAAAHPAPPARSLRRALARPLIIGSVLGVILSLPIITVG